MCHVIFEPVQIFVPLLAHIAFVWLFLLHSHRARIWNLCIWINDGVRTISIIMEALVVVSMLPSRIREEVIKQEPKNFHLPIYGI